MFRFNVGTGIAEEKQLATGLHRVRDIYCKVCVTVVGWTYVSHIHILINFSNLTKRAYSFYSANQWHHHHYYLFRILPMWAQRSTKRANP
jgi:hypothetical protein